MSESDVREDVLVPLLRALGYQTGSKYDIHRELTLRYARQSLGRKQEARDPVLRGRADYVLKVNGQLSWVLEAKSPVADVQRDQVEQAWTYACHPEVRAAYFALCNGRELLVFDSLAAPESRELLRVRYEDFGERFREVLHVLGPDAIEKLIALRSANRGVPLGLGLGSVAQIASGLIRYFEPGKPGVTHQHLQTIVLGGTVERDEEGFVIAHLDTQAPLPGMQAINERIGFKGLDLRSNRSVLPLASDEPLELRGKMMFTIPAGETLLLPGHSSAIVLPVDLSCESEMVGIGVLEAGRFHGTWNGAMTVNAGALPATPLSGTFFFRLV
jgi:hypothetical protein